MVNITPTVFAPAAWRIHRSFTHPSLSLLSRNFQRGNDHGTSHPAYGREPIRAADLLQGILVVSSFGFWAVMLGLMPVLLYRIWLA
ncbi:hypothetical protein [Bradyrhizobium sp. TM239]|uniref:hypothetical protein n=1 Tax=Bradyrhizobium sp. TM239 TaxID=2599802 RepID=UPI0027D61200|nr:hypothetical protein TM239_03740 [Bradyrhizobium sp. TM239]